MNNKIQEYYLHYMLTQLKRDGIVLTLENTEENRKKIVESLLKPLPDPKNYKVTYE